MSTLRDLRATLEQHAADLDDTERYARPVAVRARIRAVRRRRTTVAAVAAVLVLLAGAVGTEVLRGPGEEVRPAGRVVVGVDVPGTIAVQQFPYALTRLADLTDDETHVDPAEHDQAVLLAASGLGDGSATLYSQGEAIARVRGDEQVSAPVALGEAGIDLTVRFDGAGPRARAGAAVYEATGALAPGVSDGDAVFRDEVAGARLVAGAFSAPGERSVELDARSTGGAWRFAFYCTAADRDLWVNVSVDGAEPQGSSCSDPDPGPDAGVGTSTATSRIPAGEHRVRISLTDGSDGPEVTPPDGAVFGVGIYEPPAPGPRVLGTRVDTHVEYGGRSWVLDRVVDAPESVDTSDGDVLLGLAGTGSTVGARWSGRLTHGETARAESPHEAAVLVGSVLLAGDRYDVTVDGGEARLLLYRPE